MVKAPIVVILSIGLLGGVAGAQKNTPPATEPSLAEGEYGSDWAEEIAKDTADNKADRERLAAVPPGSDEARRIQRNIQERGDKAESYAERAPTSVPVLTAAADQALGNGDIARARGRADQAVSAAAAETDPDRRAAKWPSAMNMRARVAEAAGDYPAANAYAAEVLKKFPDDMAAKSIYYSTKGRVKAGAAPAAPAPAFARAPIPAAPFVPAPAAPNVKPYLDRAASLIGLRDYRGAVETARRAAALDPSNPDPRMQEAAAWAALKNVSEAVLAVSRAIERLAEGDARLPAAYNARASYKNKAGDYAGAAADAGEAIKRDPVFADAYYQRSLARKAQGQQAESLADAGKAAELKPSDYRSLYELGLRELASDGAAGAARPAESALHRAWTGLRDRAGGGFKLFVGILGALFALIGGRVFFFAQRASRTPQDADLPRAIGGQFELRRIIGEGGMGKVYEGWDGRLSRPVAVKRLRAELQASPRERERFVQEARTVALLQHPHIVSIFTIIEEGEQIYIVYERLEGRTLHEELQETPGRRLEPRRALEFLRQIAGAVDHAHERKIIHRDLKPSNVMMTRVGGKDWLKVMDFGIARRVQDALAQTSTNTVVGTPIYMAPEQAAGVVVKASDVFALGVTLYELLTGAPPFGGPGELGDKLEGRFTAASALVPGLGAAVDAVIAKALAPRHEDRYQSGAELCAAAEAALRQAAAPR